LNSALNISIKNAIANGSEEILRAVCYGYGCEKKAKEKINKLLRYQKILNRHLLALKCGAESCLDSTAFACLQEKIISITGKSCKTQCSDVVIDNSGFEAWNIRNKNCVGYEEWEKWIFYVCDQIKLEAYVQIQKCPELAIELSKEALEITMDIIQEKIPCDVVLVATAHKKASDLKLAMIATKQQCRIQFDLLKNEIPCDLTFDLYRKFVTCKLTFNMIKHIYKCGLSLDIQQHKVVLCTPTSQYQLDKLSVSDIAYLEKHNLFPTTSVEELIKGYGN